MTTTQDRGRHVGDRPPLTWVHTVCTLFCIGFVMLHYNGFLFKGFHTWSFDFLDDIPEAVNIPLCLAAVVTCHPGVNDWLWGRFLHLAAWLRALSPAPRRGLFFTGAAMFSVTAFLLRPRKLLGDGNFLIQRIESTPMAFDANAPLCNYVQSHVYHLFRAVGIHSAGVSWGLTTVLGALWLFFLARRYLQEFARDDEERITVWMLLLTMGSIHLLFGYVEHYPMLMPLVMGYFLAAARTERDGGRWLPQAGLWLGVAYAWSGVAGWLLPSFLWLLARRRDDISWPRRLQAGLWLVAPSVVTWWLVSFYWDGPIRDLILTTHPVQDADHGFLTWWGKHNSVFSLFRLACYANEWIVTAPAAIVALCLAALHGRVRANRSAIAHGPVLIWSGLALLAFSILWNPKLGPYRDWDLFAIMGLPLSLWAAHALRSRVADAPARFAVLTLSAASFVHASTWIVYHALPG